ncbi:MAG: DNA recombination protein RmuC [Patescibacteria group bacterium]|nr:DNA recombination protein RmuC [Patescibacteria group bacterium]
MISIVLGFGILGYLISRKKQENDNAVIIEWLKSMEQTVRGSTLETNKVLSQRLDTAAMIIGDLKKSIGEMTEVGRGIKNLQEFLQSPKFRGNIGEHVLADMIAQMFPKQSFHLQYSFSSGVKVDAALKTDAGILPIDAKFPMENFRAMHTHTDEKAQKTAEKEFIADVKKHIADIGRKYILPDEGTLDFALMYIPSESVYYEVIRHPDLMEYARRLRVYPVSPTTLYAHLQVLLVSFEGKELEKKTQQLMRLFQSISNDVEKIQEQYGVMARHVTNAHNSVANLGMMINQLGQKVERTIRLKE